MVADFVRTMKDWKRMCNAMGREDEYNACEKCGLDVFGCPAIYEKECDGVDWKHVEEVVTAWAAEHPEPVYPTWAEWLDALEVVVNGVNAVMMRPKMLDHIPADIAQKLGIAPREETP